MKTNRPYLSVTKNTPEYELGVTLTTAKDQTITSIRQEEIKSGNQTYWGVILTLSDTTQLVNGPINPIYSTTVGIALDKASYKKIVCSTELTSTSGKYTDPSGGNTTIDFNDGN